MKSGPPSRDPKRERLAPRRKCSGGGCDDTPVGVFRIHIGCETVVRDYCTSCLARARSRDYRVERLGPAEIWEVAKRRKEAKEELL